MNKLSYNAKIGLLVLALLIPIFLGVKFKLSPHRFLFGAADSNTPVMPQHHPWFLVNGTEPVFSSACVGDTCDVYLTGVIDRFDKYMDLERMIDTAPKGSTINLHLQGTGGETDTIIYLYNAIKSSKGVVNTIVSGPVYSAHAYLALIGKNITIEPASFFMFHKPAVVDPLTQNAITQEEACKYFIGKTDRGFDSYRKCMNGVKSYEVVTDMYFNDVINKYLTADEIVAIHNGDDVYISGSEMQKRIDKGV